MKNKALALGLILTFAWPLGSAAAWSDDPAENTQLTDATGAQHSPVIVSDGNSGAYIAWVDDASGNSDIFAQHVGANGDVQWASDGVEVAVTGNNETDPQLVANADGGVYVAWESDVENGNIYAQRLTTNGTKLWSSTGRGVAVGVRAQHTPRMTTPSDSTQGVIVAYSRQRPDSARKDIYAAKYSNGGVLRWRDSITTATTSQTELIMIDGVHILYRMVDNEVALGQVAGNGLLGYVYSVVTNSSGKTVAEPFVQNDALHTSIVFVSKGPGETADNVIRLRRLNSAPIWPRSGYRIAGTANPQANPRAVQYGSSAKSEIITWVDGASNQQNIRAQRIFRKDRMWTSAGVVVSNAGNNQHSQEMIPADDGGALVAWIDERSSANGDLYAQRIGLDGTMAWTENGVPVSTRGGVQTALKIIPSEDGFIAVWADGTGDNRDIYVQLVNGDGTL